MSKLAVRDFYYGAFLSALFRYNEDASPSLIEGWDNHHTFKVLTNTSSKEFIVYMKYRSAPTPSVKDNYTSWSFQLTEKDKVKIAECNATNCLVFLILICGTDDFVGSEIIVVTPSEYQQVKDKNSLTIGLKSGEQYRLHIEKARNTAIKIPSNRIEKRFEDLIKEEITKRIQLSENATPTVFFEDIIEEEQDISKTPHLLSENLTNTRPYAFSICENIIEANGWKELYIKTCEFLYRLNPKLFVSFADDKDLNGRSCTYFSLCEDNIRTSHYYLKCAKMHLEMCMSTKQRCQFIKKMLRKFGVQENIYLIYLSKDYIQQRRINRETEDSI